MAEEVMEIPRADLHISDEAFDYLLIQRGRLADLGSERAKWQPAYQESLLDDFRSIQAFLPARADRILDVGSGLGGIDILLARHYHQPEIWLFDGDDDCPVMHKHAETFNCMHAARRFQHQNGVQSLVTISPGTSELPPPCDLVISLQAWCFHFSPEVYADWVRRSCHPGTVLILDVRRHYVWWRKALRDAFDEVGVALSSDKFERVVFRGRAV